jgi:hypothetical protein
MKPSLIVKAACFSLSLCFGMVAAQAEVATSKQRAFTVKYKDGTIERYNVSWAAIYDGEVHEDGHPAIPLQGWFTDTRQCHWSISSHIDRRVAMINKVGQSFAESNLSKTYNSDFTNKGSDFMVVGLRSENCGDSRPRRESDISNAKANLLNVFDGLVEADLLRLKSEVKSNGEVVEVVFQ